MAFYMFPYPSTMGVWPQFPQPSHLGCFLQSPHMEPFSALFWFVGLIPDLATLRDRATSRPIQVIYGLLAMGWRGSARHWQPLSDRVSVACWPGDAARAFRSHRCELRFLGGHCSGMAHHNFSPPYFVAGAIYSGFAMVLTIAIPAA